MSVAYSITMNTPVPCSAFFCSRRPGPLARSHPVRLAVVRVTSPVGKHSDLKAGAEMEHRGSLAPTHPLLLASLVLALDAEQAHDYTQ